MIGPLLAAALVVTLALGASQILRRSLLLPSAQWREQQSFLDQTALALAQASGSFLCHTHARPIECRSCLLRRFPGPPCASRCGDQCLPYRLKAQSMAQHSGSLLCWPPGRAGAQQQAAGWGCGRVVCRCHLWLGECGPRSPWRELSHHDRQVKLISHMCEEGIIVPQIQLNQSL